MILNYILILNDFGVKYNFSLAVYLFESKSDRFEFDAYKE